MRHALYDYKVAYEEKESSGHVVVHAECVTAYSAADAVIQTETKHRGVVFYGVEGHMFDAFRRVISVEPNP